MAVVAFTHAVIIIGATDTGTELSWNFGSDGTTTNSVDSGVDGLLDVGVDFFGNPGLTFTGYIINIGGADYGVFTDTVFHYVPYNKADEDLASLVDGNPQSTNVKADPATVANCFLTGTLIATPDGEALIETLNVGDTILGADGRTLAVKWVGRQSVRNVPWLSESLHPVRIAADALAPDVPSADLTLSADHAVAVDGMLINAGALVTGDSITYVPLAEMPETFTYWHIETEAHDILLANGTPSESFIDYIGRAAFDNADEYRELYGAERIIPEADMPRITSARMLPEHMRQRIIARARAA